MTISVTFLASILVAFLVSDAQGGFLHPHQQRSSSTTFHDNTSRLIVSTVETEVLSRATFATSNRLPSTVLEAKKKKRRRRKNDTSSSSSSPSSAPMSNAPPPATSTSILDDEDELPDFDLIEDIDLQEAAANDLAAASAAASAAAPNAQVSPASKKKSIDPNDPAVIAAMKATKGIDNLNKLGTTKDLLRSRDRELESKLVVDEIVQDVPSFADYNAKKGGGAGGASSGGSSNAMSGMGKKAMKREQRRAAALEAEGKIAEEEGPGIGQVVGEVLSKLPFVENKEDKSAIKVRQTCVVVVVVVVVVVISFVWLL